MVATMERAATGFIYGLVDPRDGLLKYVGQTICSLQNRLRGHLQDHKIDTRKGRWLAELRQLSLKPKIVVLLECPSADLNTEEIAAIASMRASGVDLFNIAHGGSGVARRRTPTANTIVSADDEADSWEPPFEGDEEDQDIGDGYPPISQCTEHDRCCIESDMLNRLNGDNFWTPKLIAKRDRQIMQMAGRDDA